MRTTTVTATWGFLLCCLTATPVLAAPQTIIEEERRAVAEVQEAARGLEILIGRMQELQARARETVEQARKVETPADEAEFARRVVVLDEQLRDLSVEFARRAAALRDATDPLKSKILAALKLASLKDVEKELASIEAELEKVANADVSRRLLGLAKYYIADTMREQGVRMARGSQDDRGAAKVLRRASEKYKEVLATTDVRVPEIGSSLHAAAWHQIAHVQASLYAGYRDLVELKHNVSSNSSKMRKHGKAARHALAELQRLHSDKRYADGRRVVDVAGQDVRRLLR